MTLKNAKRKYKLMGRPQTHCIYRYERARPLLSQAFASDHSVEFGVERRDRAELQHRLYGTRYQIVDV